MSRKTGVLLVAALALSVAALGLFLCTRCDRSRTTEQPPARIDTLMVDEGAMAE
jgi:hypothetical protein